MRNRSPLVPTASETIKVIFSLGGSAGEDGVVLGGVEGVEDEGGVVGAVDEDGSFAGPGTGSVAGAGVVGATFSKNQAATNPSRPPGSRTWIH